MDDLLKNVGHGKAHSTPNEAKDASCGVYKDSIQQMPIEERLPMNQMPKGQDPMPFKLGPMAPGGRE
jgi:hypothetical protein